MDIWSGIRGSRVLVIGGGSGIGLAGAELLVNLGAEAILAGRNSAKLAAAAAGLPSAVRTEEVDGRSPESVAALFGRVGPLDHVIVSLAGKLGGGLFASLNLAELRQAFEEKFWPYLSIAQEANKVIRPGGSLTFVTGASARKVSVGGSGFVAMNGALEIMVPTLARELAPVRVNAVSPGFIVTPWYDHLTEEQRRSAEDFFIGALPVGRAGLASDVAQAILYVVGNGYVTGSVIECDGGARMAVDTRKAGLPR